MNKMTEKSLRTVNVNILGFKLPIDSAICSGDEQPSVPTWLQNNKVVQSLAFIGQDLVDIEEQVLSYNCAPPKESSIVPNFEIQK